MASAHSGRIAISCSEVTFTYTSFPNKPGNTVTETVTVDGATVSADTFEFDGSSGTHTVPLTLPDAGQHEVVARVEWNTNGATGSARAAQTLSGCGQPTPCPGAPNPDGANASGNAFGVFVEAPFISIPRQPRVESSQSGVGENHADDALAVVEIEDIAKVTGLLTVSDSRISETPSQANATSMAETARINLFDGVIVADVVRANVEAIARGDGSGFTAAGSTFAGLEVNGVRIANVRPNTRIGLPTIRDGAYVTLFETIGDTSAPDRGQVADGTYSAEVTVNMIHVHVPPLRAGRPPIDIIVSHARAQADFPQTRVCTAAAPSAVSGHAYVLSTTIDHPAAPSLLVGFSGIPSTGGAASQSLADVFVPGLVTAGAASSSSVGTITALAARSVSKASVADVNLLDGQVTATIIQSQATSRAAAGSRFSNANGTQIVDITVGGRRIADNPPPNRKFELPGIGFVVFNEQIRDGRAPGHTGLTVRAIHLHADKLAGIVPGGDIIIAESHSDATRQ
ncbi:MAG TPA: choice-of-anchor P family protein [Nevskiaceae bacterium]|nr:choice-of-anchor P family protein [Nevskiaceae bacterium]